MIRHHISAALLPLDGFTGKILGKRVLCKLDGVPLARPEWKRDGWLILTDLPSGEHRLSFRCPGFQEETLTLSGDGTREGAVILSPGRGYAFPPETAFLSLTLSGASDGKARIFAGTPGPRPLKLMRDTRAGDTAVKMFLRGPAPSPGWFLLKGRTTEAAFLRRVTASGDADAASPLTDAHPRGDTLIPAQSVLVSTGETVRIPFRDAGEAVLFCRGALKTAELRTGAEARLEWNLEA